MSPDAVHRLFNHRGVQQLGRVPVFGKFQQLLSIVPDLGEGPFHLVRNAFQSIGKFHVRLAGRAQPVVAALMPMTGGVMAVEAYDFLITNIDADGRSAAALAADVQAAYVNCRVPQS